MYQPAERIDPCMTFHTKEVRIVLFRGVHLRIPCFFLVFRGFGRTDDGGIYNRSATQHVSILFQYAVHFIKYCLPQLMLFQQVAELQKRRRVRYALIQKIEAHELPHGVTVVYAVLRIFV